MRQHSTPDHLRVWWKLWWRWWWLQPWWLHCSGRASGRSWQSLLRHCRNWCVRSIFGLRYTCYAYCWNAASTRRLSAENFEYRIAAAETDNTLAYAARQDLGAATMTIDADLIFVCALSFVLIYSFIFIDLFTLFHSKLLSLLIYWFI
jgi:hypothetical protein